MTTLRDRNIMEAISQHDGCCVVQFTQVTVYIETFFEAWKY